MWNRSRQRNKLTLYKNKQFKLQSTPEASEVALFLWRMSMEQTFLLPSQFNSLSLSVWMVLSTYPIDHLMRRLMAWNTSGVVQDCFAAGFLLFIISLRWFRFQLYIARTKLMAWLPKKSRFSAACIVLSTFVPVLDLYSASSVLNVSVLEHPILKRNIKKHTGLKLYNKSKICQWALFCRGWLKSNREKYSTHTVHVYTEVFSARQLNRCPLI